MLKKINLLILILVIHSVILTKLIYFPYPELFIYPYLTNHGLKPYSQILDQHFPGLMFLPVNLGSLGMTTPEIARVWSIAIVLVVHAMLFLISRNLFVNILYLIWQPFFEGWILWIDSFLPLLLLPAFYFCQKNKVFLTGIFLGLGIVFKQTIIPLSIFVMIYFFWKTRNIKNTLQFLLGLSIPVTLTVVYFAGIGVLRDIWYWTVIFNVTEFAKSGRGAGPTMAHFTRVLLVFGTPFLVLKKIKDSYVKILLIFLIGALLGLSTRFDFVHFQPALPFAILATVYGLRGFGFKTGYLLIAVWWLTTFYKGHLGNEVLAFDSGTYEIAAKIKIYTNPGEKIFVFGGQPHLYQLSDTLPAGNIFVFQFPWFYKIAQNRILEGIIKDKPNIIVYDATTEVEKRKIADFAKDINDYISQNYQKIDNIGQTDILKRR